MPTPNSPLLIYPKKDLSVATILCYTQNADGSWTAVSTGAFTSGAVSFLKYLDSIGLNLTKMQLEAITVEASYMNRTPGPIDVAVTIIENRRRQVGAGALGASGADPGDILPLAAGYDLSQIIWAYNGGTTHNDVYTFYGDYSSMGNGVQGVGAQKTSMTFQLKDTSYTTVSSVAGVTPFTMVRA